MVNSKQKGGAFEREVCKNLSLWVTHGKKSDCYWRSAMSGGRATVHGTDVRQCGDVASVSPEGHILTDLFLIECKHVRDLRLRGIFDDKKSRDSLHGYWLRANTDAHRFNKHPMVIAKENGGPILVCIPIIPATLSYSILKRIYSVNVERWGASIYLFDELLKQKFKL